MATKIVLVSLAAFVLLAAAEASAAANAEDAASPKTAVRYGYGGVGVVNDQQAGAGLAGDSLVRGYYYGHGKKGHGKKGHGHGHKRWHY
jgi:hypothetical protein